MTCEEFWNRLPESGQDHSEPQGAFARHGAECASCATRLTQQRRIAIGLHALGAELTTAEAPPRVEAALLSAFRAAQASNGRRRRSWWTSPVLPWAVAGLASAALVFAFWTAPKRQAHPAAPAAHHNAPARVELAAFTMEETDDGFIPLPNAPQIDPNDDVNVVRMELPRSAMLAVGLEVSPEQVSDTVEAEVKLGPDGLARAVRFME